MTQEAYDWYEQQRKGLGDEFLPLGAAATALTLRTQFRLRNYGR